MTSHDRSAPGPRRASRRTYQMYDPIAATAMAAAANRAVVESEDCRRKLSIAAAITNSGHAANTICSAGLALARSDAATPSRPGAATAVAMSRPPEEHKVMARSSGTAWGSSHAQNTGHIESRENIHANAPSVRPL